MIKWIVTVNIWVRYNGFRGMDWKRDRKSEKKYAAHWIERQKNVSQRWVLRAEKDSQGKKNIYFASSPIILNQKFNKLFHLIYRLVCWRGVVYIYFCHSFNFTFSDLRGHFFASRQTALATILFRFKIRGMNETTEPYKVAVESNIN